MLFPRTGVSQAAADGSIQTGAAKLFTTRKPHVWPSPKQTKHTEHKVVTTLTMNSAVKKPAHPRELPA